MARWRVGPVRVGGGRKASFTVGAGPFGVTVGGRRRRGMSYPSYASDSPTEWEVTRSQSEIARINFENSATSRGLAIGLFVLPLSLLFLALTSGTVTLSIYVGLALVSGALTIYQNVVFQLVKNLSRDAEPSTTQLKMWVFVQDGAKTTHIPVFGWYARFRYWQARRIAQMQADEGVPEEMRIHTEPTRLSFRTISLANTVFLAVFGLVLGGSIGSISNAVGDCVGYRECEPLEARLTQFQALGVTLIALVVLNLLLLLRLGTFSVFLQEEKDYYKGLMDWLRRKGANTDEIESSVTKVQQRLKSGRADSKKAKESELRTRWEQENT